MSALNNFDSWKTFLQNRLEQAKEHGMSHETITNIAEHVGSYLANNVEPHDDEQAVLKELWSVASEEEQSALASTMIKLVEKH